MGGVPSEMTKIILFYFNLNLFLQCLFLTLVISTLNYLSGQPDFLESNVMNF